MCAHMTTVGLPLPLCHARSPALQRYPVVHACVCVCASSPWACTWLGLILPQYARTLISSSLAPPPPPWHPARPGLSASCLNFRLISTPNRSEQTDKLRDLASFCCCPQTVIVQTAIPCPPANNTGHHFDLIQPTLKDAPVAPTSSITTATSHVSTIGSTSRADHKIYHGGRPAERPFAFPRFPWSTKQSEITITSSVRLFGR